jgi:hypothetical protein
MSKIGEKLLAKKDALDTAKSSKSNLEGQRDVLYKRLEDDFGCKTIDDGDNLLRKIEDQIKAGDKKVEDGLQVLEEKYDWGVASAR